MKSISIFKNLLEEELKKQSEDEIGNIYMIGDNPKSDIRGGNNNGCISILVRCIMQIYSFLTCNIYS